jgi:hypothetical protein
MGGKAAEQRRERDSSCASSLTLKHHCIVAAMLRTAPR